LVSLRLLNAIDEKCIAPSRIDSADKDFKKDMDWLTLYKGQTHYRITFVAPASRIPIESDQSVDKQFTRRV
jgi:hypothetical protein